MCLLCLAEDEPGRDTTPPCRYCGATYAACVDGEPCCKACLHADGHDAQPGRETAVREGDRVTHKRESGPVGVVLGWTESGHYMRVRWDHLDGFIGVHPLGDLYRVVEP